MSPTPSLDKDKVDAKGCCPCPKTEVKAKSGDTVILPCSINLSHWKPNKALLSWEKRLGPGNNVMVHSQKGICMEVDQGRTSLPFWKDGKGDLELRDVVPSDSGPYIFWITQISDKEKKPPMCCDVILNVDPAKETVDPGEKKCSQVDAEGCCPRPKTEVRAETGDTVILPCAINLSSWNPNEVLLSWEKRLGPGNNVTVHSQKGINMEVDQERTSLPFWKEGKGDLELRDIVPADSGIYTFSISEVSDEEEKQSMCCEVNLSVDPEEETVDPGEKKCCQGCHGGQK
ncbi:uncharacterized protein [Aquarana catesbeiana]|uniref:uncharacterized protein n=1 Tax=Aquarana catesbeiana TaxID=8400 RepID=UPI003CCA0BC9